MGSWILPPPITEASEPVRCKLVCVPQAGMGAWAFHSWQRHLPNVSLLPVELPGRNTRLREPCYTDLCALAKDAVTALEPELGSTDVPYTIFGHSMGAWLAYEMTKEIERRGLPPPARLIVSGNRSPQLAGAQHDVDPTRLHTLGCEEFWQAFERRYGANPHLGPGSPMRQLMWATLRSDFQMTETYTPQDSTPLPTGITAIGGSQDPRYTKEQVLAWQQETSAGDFELVWLECGHNYITAPPQELLAAIRYALRIED